MGAIRGLAGWAWKTRVKCLLHFFTRLHNYETFRHIYTRQSSEQLDIFELAWVLHNRSSALSDNLTSAFTSNNRAKTKNKQQSCQD